MDRHFLIMVDLHTRWLDVQIMTNGVSTEKTIGKFRSTLAVISLPESIVTINGPPFTSKDFELFCSNNGIIHTLTPPHHPPSNGLAEKHVDILKRNLRKTLYHNKEKGTKFTLQHQIDNFLFKHRNTPVTTTGVSRAAMVLRSVL